MSALSSLRGLVRVAAIVGPGVIFVPIFAAVLRPLVDDYRSMRFPTADGVVVTSAPKRQQYGARYDWDLAYTYTVGGRTYTGRRYAATGYTWYHASEIDRLVASVPAGARVPVAYDPADPAEAVLRPGQPGRIVERAALALLALAAAGVYVGFVLLAPWRAPAPGGRAPLFDPRDPKCVARTRDGLLVRLPPTPVVHPLLAIVAALGVVLLISRTRPTPPDPYPVWAGLLIVVAAPALVAVLFGLTRAPVLMLDLGRKRLLFRPGWPWRDIALRFAEVNVVGLSSRTEKRKSGVATFYQVWLGHTATGVQRDVLLCEYEDVADADALVAWLRELILGAPPTAGGAAGAVSPDPSATTRAR